MTRWLLSLSLAVAWPQVAPDPVAAEAFLLTSGEQIEGEIVQRNGNIVTIMRDGRRGVKRAPLGAVKSVEITMSDGAVVRGGLSAWDDGVYTVATTNGVLLVEDGRLVGNAPAPAPSPSFGPDDQDLPTLFAKFMDEQGSATVNMSRDEIFRRFLEWNEQQGR